MEEKTMQKYMKEMSPMNRVKYFLDYYKWHVLLGLGLFALAFAIVHTALRPSSDPFAELVLVNADQIELEKTDYFDLFSARQEYRGEGRLSIDASLSIDTEHPSGSSASSYQILAAMFAAGEVDLFISDENTFRLFAENHGFRDLYEIMPADFLERYQDKLICYVDPETGERVACGLSLEESGLFQKERLFTRVPIAGIASRSAESDAGRELLFYLTESSTAFSEVQTVQPHEALK